MTTRSLPPGALVLVACLTPSPFSTPAPRAGIERAGTLRAARAVHTATPLPSGAVLVTGGMGPGETSLAAVELIDPRDGTTRELAPMAVRRAGHTATLLPDGRVLVAGGYNGDYVAALELFDPSDGSFHAAGNLLEGRSGHTANLLMDGRVLFVGGVGKGWTFLSSAEIYDPVTERIQPAGSLTVPRESHTATLLADGRVLVVGGHYGRRAAMRVHASSEIFDPRTGGFEAGGTLRTPRHKHDAVRLADGRVLVVGGADRTDRVHFATSEVFDPGRWTFAPGPTMREERYKIAGTAVLLPGGDVLVGGGARTAEILDAGTTGFRDVDGRFPEAYRFATATALANGDVLIAGGYSEGIAATDGIWRFHRR